MWHCLNLIIIYIYIYIYKYELTLGGRLHTRYTPPLIFAFHYACKLVWSAKYVLNQLIDGHLVSLG